MSQTHGEFVSDAYSIAVSLTKSRELCSQAVLRISRGTSTRANLSSYPVFLVTLLLNRPRALECVPYRTNEHADRFPRPRIDTQTATPLYCQMKQPATK